MHYNGGRLLINYLPMPQSNTYKYTTWLFGIIALVLLVLLIMKGPNEPVQDLFNEINARLASCRSDIMVWNQAHPRGSVMIDDDWDERDALVERCFGNIEASQDIVE